MVSGKIEPPEPGAGKPVRPAQKKGSSQEGQIPAKSAKSRSRAVNSGSANQVESSPNREGERWGRWTRTTRKKIRSSHKQTCDLSEALPDAFYLTSPAFKTGKDITSDRYPPVRSLLNPVLVGFTGGNRRPTDISRTAKSRNRWALTSSSLPATH